MEPQSDQRHALVSVPFGRFVDFNDSQPFKACLLFRLEFCRHGSLDELVIVSALVDLRSTLDALSAFLSILDMQIAALESRSELIGRINH